MSKVSRKELRMPEAERNAYLESHQYGRLATVSEAGEPHVAPVGYIMFGGNVYFHALESSRRGKDIKRGSRVSLCVDDGLGEGEGYRDRKGVILYGECRQLGDDDSALLKQVRDKYGEVFFGAEDAEYERRTHAWYEVRPDRMASWDFSRIPEGADRFASR